MDFYRNLHSHKREAVSARIFLCFLIIILALTIAAISGRPSKASINQNVFLNDKTASFFTDWPAIGSGAEHIKERIDSILRLTSTSGNKYDQIIIKNFPDIDAGNILETINYLAEAGFDSIILLEIPPLPHPSILNADKLQDRLNNGNILKATEVLCPILIDIFDREQVDIYKQYFQEQVSRLDPLPTVKGFIPSWGFQGENMFYLGGCEQNVTNVGEVSAGYSRGALEAYVDWLNENQLVGSVVSQEKVNNLDLEDPNTWPQPSTSDPQDPFFVMFIRFRQEKTNQFTEELVNAVKQVTNKPIATFTYGPLIIYNPTAANHAFPKNPDAYLAQPGTSQSQGLYSLELDNIWWGDSVGMFPSTMEFNNFRTVSWGWFKIQAVRELARGGYLRSFYRPEYVETGLFQEASNFVLEEVGSIRGQLQELPVEVAVVFTRFSASALPFRSGQESFLTQHPTAAALEYIDVLENLGVNYDLVDENILINPSRLSQYKKVIVPDWKYVSQALFPGEKKELEKAEYQTKLLFIDDRSQSPQRENIGNILEDAGVSPHLSAPPLIYTDNYGTPCTWTPAGMTHNIIYNFSDQTQEVQVKNLPGEEGPQSLTLEPYSYQVIALAVSTPTPTPSPQCRADVNGSGRVEIGDIGGILFYWGGVCETGSEQACIADVNESERVEIGDIGGVLYYWGGVCQ